MTDHSPYRKLRKKERRRRRAARVAAMFNLVLITATMVTAMMLALALLSPYVNPNKLVHLSFLGLGAPVLMVANVVLMLFWILRWKPYFAIPLLALLIGAGKIPLLFRPSLGKDNDPARDNNSFVMMSYNVMGFVNRNGRTTNMDRTLDFVNEQNPDILCMQEYQTTENIRQEAAQKRLSKLPHHRISYRIKGRSGGWGLAIYSKYPIAGYSAREFENSTNSSMWVDVVIRKDTVRILNNHLQTTAVTSSDKEFIKHDLVVSDSDRRSGRVMGILQKLADNYRKRADQADILASIIEESPYPVIVCGDFNDTPISYTYRKVRGRLKDSFVEKGKGMNHTYRGFFNLFRIDYIFHSRSIEVLQYHTPSSNLSDHNPVITHMKLNKNKQP